MNSLGIALSVFIWLLIAVFGLAVLLVIVSIIMALAKRGKK